MSARSAATDRPRRLAPRETFVMLRAPVAPRRTGGFTRWLVEFEDLTGVVNGLIRAGYMEVSAAGFADLTEEGRRALRAR